MKHYSKDAVKEDLTDILIKIIYDEIDLNKKLMGFLKSRNKSVNHILAILVKKK